MFRYTLMRRFLKVFVLLFLLCSGSAYAKEEIKIFFYRLNSGFMNHVQITMEKMAKQRGNRGYKIRSFDANGDAFKQYEQLKNHISIGDMVVISVSDEEYLPNMMKIASEHDAKVVLFGSSPSANLAKSYDNAWYVGFEMFDSAHKQYSMIKRYLNECPDYDKNNNGALDVVFLQGREHEFSTHIRTQVILDNLEKYGVKINPVSYNFDDYSFSTAYEYLKKQIRLQGIENIEMVISNNDAMALGAIKALNEINYNLPYSFFNGHHHIPVFGIDGISEALKSVDAGMLTGTAIADYSALSRVIMLIFESASVDDFEKIVWYRVNHRSIFIPYRAFSRIKVYNAQSLSK